MNKTKHDEKKIEELINANTKFPIDPETYDLKVGIGVMVNRVTKIAKQYAEHMVEKAVKEEKERIRSVVCPSVEFAVQQREKEIVEIIRDRRNDNRRNV